VALVSFREDIPMFSPENIPTETGKYEERGAIYCLNNLSFEGNLRGIAVDRREYLSNAQHPAPFEVLPRKL
jgi:hypothetical protein